MYDNFSPNQKLKINLIKGFGSAVKNVPIDADNTDKGKINTLSLSMFVAVGVFEQAGFNSPDVKKLSQINAIATTTASLDKKIL